MVPKKGRDALIHAAGDKCQICTAGHNLQLDHRIPYEVAGEPASEGKEPYQVLCGSCNRKKSWACEHCVNWLKLKNPDTCRSCYWANSSAYTHIAMEPQRRVELVWTGDEVSDFERIRSEATCHGRSVPDEVKQLLKRDAK